MTSNTVGVALALLGGILVGNCMLPLKRIRSWPWECTWLVFSFVSMILVPAALSLYAVPAWPALYWGLSVRDLYPSFAFGFGWGIAQVLFGIAVQRLGMALGFAVVVGLGTVFGTLIPFLAHQQGSLLAGRGLMLLCNCALMVLGVGLSGCAGQMRDSRKNTSPGSSYQSGFIIAAISGVLSSMLNLSFSFGGAINDAAVKRGAHPAVAVVAVWPIALAGGFIPNSIYSLYLLIRNRSWSNFRTLVPDGLWSGLMGLLWIFAVVIYGLATYQLGPLGDSAGWAIYQITMVLMACVAGVIAGDWKSSSRGVLAVFLLSVVPLLVATALLAQATK
jgi:L-rhamnose-H+ transport protein